MSDVEELIRMSEPILLALARAAHKAKRQARDVVLLAIAVDSSWRFLVDHLMPSYDWPSLRAQGTPVACGVMDVKSMRTLLEECDPRTAAELSKPLLAGAYRVVLFSDQGIAVAHVLPLAAGGVS